MMEWRKRLALAPKDGIHKALKSTTQMAMNVEAEKRIVGRRRLKKNSYLRENRINDDFAYDIFFLTVWSNTGDTCIQLFFREKTNYIKVFPMKT